MKFFSGMAASVSALTAEKLRLDVIANNIANIDSTRSPGGGPFRRKTVVFQEIADQVLNGTKKRAIGQGVQVAGILEDRDTPLRQEHNPSHPDADANGDVWYPNVDLSVELINMMNAQRAYQINVGVLNTSRQMAEKALEIGRG